MITNYFRKGTFKAIQQDYEIAGVESLARFEKEHDNTRSFDDTSSLSVLQLAKRLCREVTN